MYSSLPFVPSAYIFSSTTSAAASNYRTFSPLCTTHLVSLDEYSLVDRLSHTHLSDDEQMEHRRCDIASIDTYSIIE